MNHATQMAEPLEPFVQRQKQLQPASMNRLHFPSPHSDSQVLAQLLCNACA
jgi:hypothetical protein